MSLIYSLLALSFLIFFHELGHYTVARLFKVTINIFSIGFGKPILKYIYKNTEYRISIIPLGGYVMLKGQNDLDSSNIDTQSGSYQNLHPLKKILILLAGPFANIFIAFILFLIITIKPVNYIAPKIGEVLKDSPAKIAGIKKGDDIISINNIKVKTWNDIIKNININNNQIINIKIKREVIINLSIKPKLIKYKNIFNETETKYMIGIKASQNNIVKINLTPYQSIKFAYDNTINGSLLIFYGLKKLVLNLISSYKDVGSVISMVKITNQAAQISYSSFLFMVAIISINLAVINLLPIPALDGGHIIFNLYEFITKRKANIKVIIYLTYLGWSLLLFLMVLGIYNDIERLFTN